jgi:hypothetical protein
VQEISQESHRCNKKLDRSLGGLSLPYIKPYINLHSIVLVDFLHFSCFQVSLVWHQKSIIFLLFKVMVNLLRCTSTSKTYRGRRAISLITVWVFLLGNFQVSWDLPNLAKLKKLQVRFWQGMAASMVACYSMVAADLVKKPVMVGKCERSPRARARSKRRRGLVEFRFHLSWGKVIFDGSTNKN